MFSPEEAEKVMEDMRKLVHAMEAFKDLELLVLGDQNALLHKFPESMRDDEELQDLMDTIEQFVE